jgi:hypothetical protein
MAKLSQTDLLALLAEELEAAHAQLEALGVVLIGDPLVAVRHITELQALDHAGQRCASIAEILRSRNLHAAAEAARLESIPARMRAAS